MAVFAHLRRSMALFLCPELRVSQDGAAPRTAVGFFNVTEARQFAQERRARTGLRLPVAVVIGDDRRLLRQLKEVKGGQPFTLSLPGFRLIFRKLGSLGGDARHEIFGSGQE